MKEYNVTFCYGNQTRKVFACGNNEDEAQVMASQNMRRYEKYDWYMWRIIKTEEI